MAEARRETATTAGHSVDNILCTCTHDDGYYSDEYVPDPNCPVMSDREEEVVVEDEDEVDQDEDAQEGSDNEEQDEAAETGVGEHSCDDAEGGEGGSSANCPLSVLDCRSELEGAPSEDLPMCETGKSSEFPLSVEGSRSSSEDEGVSGN